MTTGCRAGAGRPSAPRAPGSRRARASGRRAGAGRSRRSRSSSSASRPCSGEDDGVPLLLQPAAEQEPVHRVVVRDQDRSGRERRRSRARLRAGAARALRSSAAYSLLDPVRRARRRLPARRSSRAARARGRAPRSRPPPKVWPFDLSVCAARRSLSGVAALQCALAASRGAPARRARNVSITSLRKSSPPSSCRLSSARLVEGEPPPFGCRCRRRGCARPSAAASSSGRIGFAT